MHIFKNLRISVPCDSVVLVVEDDESFRGLLCLHLRRLGYAVEDCAGIEKVEGDQAIARNGDEAAPIRISRFGLVFLDHYFQSATDNGTTLTPILVNHGAIVIGMSRSRSANESMLRQGATAAFQKRSLLSALNLAGDS